MRVLRWKDDEKRSFEEASYPFVAGWSSYSEYIIQPAKPLEEGASTRFPSAIGPSSASS